jgi:flagellar assembly factor FliW
VKIQTRTFGTIDIDEGREIRLTEPMPGFANLTRYAVLDPDPESPFKWFQSLERSDVCFLIVDPVAFFPDYRVELPASRLSDLELEGSGDSAVAVILTVRDDPANTTANLLAPLVFNVRRGLGRQVVLEGSSHPVRAPLFETRVEAA